jgi:methionyl-tRNA formyltransferase
MQELPRCDGEYRWTLSPNPDSHSQQPHRETSPKESRVPVRIVYMGTPEFACPTLRALAREPDVDLVLVVTQPDRRAGRGRQLVPPPVKNVATELGLSVYQTASLRTADQRRPIVESAPDLIIVAAFGLILGPSILNLPPMGCVNLHASLLPAYRGAAPIAAAIASGDPVTGVTLMRMKRGLDTGPILARTRLDLMDSDTTESLTSRLAISAADLMVAALHPFLRGDLPDIPQGRDASLTRPLVKSDGWLDWERPAVELERHVRAMWPWPRAWTTLANGQILQVHRSHAEDEVVLQDDVGTIVRHGSDLAIVAREGLLVVDIGQLPNGNPAPGSVLARRAELGPGQRLGQTGRPASTDPMIVPVDH